MRVLPSTLVIDVRRGKIPPKSNFNNWRTRTAPCTLVLQDSLTALHSHLISVSHVGPDCNGRVLPSTIVKSDHTFLARLWRPSASPTLLRSLPMLYLPGGKGLPLKLNLNLPRPAFCGGTLSDGTRLTIATLFHLSQPCTPVHGPRLLSLKAPAVILVI